MAIDMIVRGAPTWSELVWQRDQGKCTNCGATENVHPQLIVCEEAGGKKTPDNAALLCRTCDLANRIAQRKSSSCSGEHTRPVNFFVSQDLHKALKNGLATEYGFKSISALVRFLMEHYIRNQSYFKDLGLYEDAGPSEVKVNVWVDRKVYSAFRKLAVTQSTVTDTVKGLLRMYEAETSRFVGRSKKNGQ